MQLQKDYAVRPVRPDDFPELTELLNLCFREMAGRDMLSLEDTSRDLSAPGFDREKDTRIVLSPEGRIVACQDVWALVDPPVHPFVWGRVHPEHRGRGIGCALLGWALDRARQALDRVPEGVRVAADASSLSDWEPGRALLLAAGFEVCRHGFEMRIDLAEPPREFPRPPGIEIRRYRHPDEAEAVCRASVESFKDHYGHVDEPFETEFERFTHFQIEDEEFDPDLWFVATDGDEIAGICLSRPSDGTDRDVGYVSSLAVRRPWRRRGIARALLGRGFDVFRARGHRAVQLDVDAESLTGAVRLYEQAGMYVNLRTDSFELELRPGRELGTTEA